MGVLFYKITYSFKIFYTHKTTKTYFLVPLGSILIKAFY
jgi:hypothetical protein